VDGACADLNASALTKTNFLSLYGAWVREVTEGGCVDEEDVYTDSQECKHTVVATAESLLLHIPALHFPLMQHHFNYNVPQDLVTDQGISKIKEILYKTPHDRTEEEVEHIAHVLVKVCGSLKLMEFEMVREIARVAKVEEMSDKLIMTREGETVDKALVFLSGHVAAFQRTTKLQSRRRGLSHHMNEHNR
jgi:hypothetical protein